MSSANLAPTESQPYGLPMGTVRGFLSVLICSFFWILLLYPWENAPSAPLGHFFLLTLVFLAFASHPLPEVRRSFLPWVMRVIFVGGSIAVVLFTMVKHPDRLSARLTPNPADIVQWPALLACFAGGFAVSLLLRWVLGRENPMFQTIRAWVGVLAMLLLLFETIFQFTILPTLSDKPSQEALKIWEGLLVAIVAGYFGSRA